MPLLSITGKVALLSGHIRAAITALSSVNFSSLIFPN